MHLRLQESTYTLKAKTKVESQPEDAEVDSKAGHQMSSAIEREEQDGETSDSPQQQEEENSTNTSIKNDNDSSTTVVY